MRRSRRASSTSATEKELAFEVSTGLSYNVAPPLVARRRGPLPQRLSRLDPRPAPRELCGLCRPHACIYDGGEWSVTATWQPQLFGGPSAAGSSLEFDDHEKREFRLKLSKEF